MDSSWSFVCADCLPVNGRFHRGLKNSTSIFRFRRAKSVKGKLNDVFDEIRPKTLSKWPSSKIRGGGQAACEISFSCCFSIFQAEYCHLHV